MVKCEQGNNAPIEACWVRGEGNWGNLQQAWGWGGRQNTIKEYKITLFHFLWAGGALKGNFALPPPPPPPKDLGSPGGIQSDIY